MHTEIVEREKSLQRLFERAEDIQKNDLFDLELRSAFESYLCIRTYAYVETSIRTIILHYVRTVSGNDPVEKFVASQLKRQPNLWYSQLIKLLDSFNTEWTVQLKSGTTERMRRSLDSLVPIRNNIAHGDDVDISLTALQDYFLYTSELVRLVFEACETDSHASGDT